MFANGQSFFVFATFFVATVCAEKKQAEKLDDFTGFKFVDPNGFLKAKMEMWNMRNGYGRDWLIMPDGNGNPAIAMLAQKSGQNQYRILMDWSIFHIMASPEEKVTLRLHTRSNPKDGIVINETNLDSLIFDESKDTKVIIHGWRSSVNSSTVTNIRDAYLTSSNVQVITVDWSEPANNIFYPAAAVYTEKVGHYVGRIIDELVSRKRAKYERFHLIGHSLGAHTAGVAGSSTSGTVARITGLDPALPGFQDLSNTEISLDRTDAEFVDVIHTCAGALGMSAPIGHADFYPNGGTPYQPGCCCIIEVTAGCSHGRSHEFFSESIYSTNSFEGISCDSWSQFKHNSCEGGVVPMGEYASNTIRGVFYLQTNYQSPFGLGRKGTSWTSSLSGTFEDNGVD